MADFAEIVKKHAGEDGSIPASAINTLVTAIKTSVGNEYVEKERYKEKLNEIDTLKSEKQTAEDSATTAEKWKTKYEALKNEFNDYKGEQAKKESRAAKEKAYRELLKAAGISEKRIDAVLKVSDVDGVELDDKGTIKGAKELTESVKSEWSDFIVTTTTKGADTPNPPANTGGTMTRDQIMAIKDRSERRAAIAANMNLFQKGE